jgi:beta-glucosidase
MTETYPYQDKNLPVDARVTDLLDRMTLGEKVAQLHGVEPPEDETWRLFPEAMRKNLAQGVSYIGSFNRNRDTAKTVEYLNTVQKFLVEETRLGIPALVLGEGLHGFMATEATSFPQAIGMASTWDPDLVERIFSVVALEMRVRGAHYVLSPVLDLAREPRWGRTEETYGEDPYLASRLGVAAVQGLQGKRFAADPEKVVATAKHYAAHGQPEGGTNCAPANFAERILREEFLAPFQAVVEEGGIGSVMASYNEVNGVPVHINPWLLKEVLRDEWDFDGIVISDGWGVDDLFRLHYVATDANDAARQSFLSGVDLELGRCFANLVEEVRTGHVPEELIDRAVARVLALKFQFGLFENPYADVDEAVRVTNHADHRTLALEAAQKAIVLLKNEEDLLPLDMNNLDSLAVIGPNAATVRLGGYSGVPGNTVTVLDGIRGKVGDQVEVRYTEGCGITQSDIGPAMWHEDLAELFTPEEDQRLIAEAVEIVRAADVALLVLGDNEQTCREAWSETHLGDRDSLDLPGRQEELLRAVVETGTPTILLLIQGRPATVNYAAEHVPAILEGWYLGQAAGTAVADVLFGDVNPGGKLPITFPRSVGQLPVYYYHKPSARRGYLFADKSPLFPFGHGLSYTNFEFSNLRLEPQKITTQENTLVMVEVTNTGERTGDEVVQLYLRDQVSTLTRPVKLLKGFQRVTLEPGETQTVEFTLTPEALSFWNAQMQYVVEPGLFDVMVGSSSVDVETIVLEVVEA